MHPILTTLRTASILLSFAGLSYGGYEYAVKFGNMDPFANFRGVKAVDMQTGIELSDVELKSYQNGKLTAKTKVGRMTVSQDRSQLDLADIHEGVYQDKSPVKFAANHGTWNLTSRELQLDGLARVAGKDFDIQTASALFNRNTQQLNVPTKMSGTLFGGKISAGSFVYEAKTGDSDATAVHWQGKPPADQVPKEVPNEEVSRPWAIDCDHSRKKGNVLYYDNAKATDGEVLVIAPKVEWDRATDVLTATGRVSYFSGKADTISDKAIIFRKDKKAHFMGNVVMLIKGKKDQDKPPVSEDVPGIKPDAFPDKLNVKDQKPSVLTAEEKKKVDDLRSGKNVHEYPLHLQAQDLTYWYQKGDRHAIFSGDPVAKQDFPSGQWRRGESYDGTFDGEKELLHLTSQPSKRQVHYRNSVGDLALAGKAEFSTKDTETEDDEDLEFWDASALFKDTSGEDTRSAKNGDSKSPPSTSTSTGTGTGTGPTKPPTPPSETTPVTPPPKQGTQR